MQHCISLMRILAALLLAFFIFSAFPLHADDTQETADTPTETPVAQDAAQPAAAIDPNDVNTGGAGDLLVAPTRVVLDGKKRTADVLLNNKGTKEATYRISFAHLKMDDSGHYSEVSAKDAQDSSLKFADNLLRYSPHQVTLKPGETQVVKVMMRAPEGLADGEYCSHLLFRAVPDASAGDNVEAQKVEAGKISVHLIPIYGVTIPLIVRHGNLSAQAKITNVHVAGHNVMLTLSRSGSESVYGDVIITQADSDTVVGQLRGIAVLATNNARRLTIPVSDQASGQLAIEYRARKEDGGDVLDKTSISM